MFSVEQQITQLETAIAHFETAAVQFENSGLSEELELVRKLMA